MANEKRLIDANALMDAFRSYMVERYDKEKCISEENCKTCENSCLWRKIVSVAPTVDAVEVVHGRWEDEHGGKYANPRYRCSVCKRRSLYEFERFAWQLEGSTNQMISAHTEKGKTMIDKVVYFLSEEFQKEGLLVPFGTIYRIAENFIENMDGKELVLCGDCKHCSYDTMFGSRWCNGKEVRADDFCSYGERKDHD